MDNCSVTLEAKLENQNHWYKKATAATNLPLRKFIAGNCHRRVKHIHDARVNLIDFVLAQAMFPPVAFYACEFPKTALSMKQIHFGLKAVFQSFRIGNTCSAY